MWGHVRMSLRVPLGLSIAALVFFGGALTDPSLADPLPAGPSNHPATTPSAMQPRPTLAQVATVTVAAANIAATAEAVSPTPSQPAASVSTQTKPKASVTKRIDRTRLALKPSDRVRSEARRPSADSQRAPPAVQVAQAIRAVGLRQTGAAAWYGGSYIGRRTSSGERLDTVHPTAAHRSLPLNSLARVTNLGNGRSVIVRVTDRGPVSESLLIDMSPKAAEQLDMKTAGIARVMVEQVVAVTAGAK
jgi:rare lipoprotein A (peptidoglycan hydrolase)